MVKTFFKKLGLALLTLMLVQLIAFAQGTSETEPETPAEASFKSRCANAKAMKFPPCATSPSECGSQPTGGAIAVKDEKGDIKAYYIYRYPFNCIFLQEPIGGDPGYDLYKITPTPGGNVYSLWYGEAIVGKDTGPVQAVLAYEEGKETQGPFGLLYNYLGLVYTFLSGVIVAFVVLVAIIGGIRMSVSRGVEAEYTAGRSMILKALVGMVLWFTASVILYTINPTFFAF